MGSLSAHTQSSSSIIPLLEQTVYVNGLLDENLFCTSITLGCGAGSCTASFKSPQLLFDSSRNTWREALVSVYVKSPDGSIPSTPDWLGYLDVDSASLNAQSDSVSFSGNSITQFLGKVYVGQTAHAPVVTYKLTDAFGKSTGLTPAKVLQDIYGDLPTYYKTRVGIGNVSCINNSSLNTPPLVFRCSSVLDATEQILGLFGDVTYTERYSGSKAYLDIFRVQDTNRPSYTCRVANYEDPTTNAISIANISHTTSTADAITRIIVYGAPRRFLISCTNYDTTAERKLREGWSASEEARVLADPRLANDESHSGTSTAAPVFRKYYLPSCLANVNKLKDLGIARATLSGEPTAYYEVQVWKFDSVLTRDSNGDYTGAASSTPTLLENVKLSLDQGYFELGTATDGLRITAITTGTDGQRLYTWTQANIGITLTVESQTQYVYYDTGQDSQSDLNFDFKSDGLTEIIQRDDLIHLQATNEGFPFTSYTGASLEFPTLLINPDTGTYAEYSSATVVTDPTATLRQTAKEVLKTKNRRHQSYSIRIPWFDRSAQPGKQLSIQGFTHASPKPLMISQVTHNLENNSTEITADNVKPPKRTKVDVT